MRVGIGMRSEGGKGGGGILGQSVEVYQQTQTKFLLEILERKTCRKTPQGMGVPALHKINTAKKRYDFGHFQE